MSFVLFFYPLTIDTFSVNYSFLLLPILFMLIDGKLRRPHEDYLLLMALYTLIFIVASVYQYQFYEDGLRRAVSFALFMSVFTYMFLKIDAQMIASFKDAIVVISVLLSISTILNFFVSGGASLGFEAKVLVGSQRFGFIYLVALWLVYVERSAWNLNLILKYSVLLVLLAGLLLTFSRSSIFALLASVAVFTLANCFSWFRRPKLKKLGTSILAITGASVLVVLLVALIPVVFDFFDARLVAYMLDSDTISADLENPESSGGIRVFLWQSILDFVLHNPLTGSGYLGVWVVFGDHGGSAHGQYTDVLFRTGFIGFLAYGYLLVLVGRYLYRNERGLFWGFVAVLLYGIFHETFKESQGGFLLAFLLGMLSQSTRQSNLGISRSRANSHTSRKTPATDAR